jgi:hypothetical protein
MTLRTSRLTDEEMESLARQVLIQQGLDRAHARLLDLIEHPEKIEDLPDAEDDDG